MASSDEEAYEVERILADKVENGTIKYLVKWQGYPDEQSTWEPPENFDAPETLEAWAKQKKRGDILETEDLRRIQQQIDAFQEAQPVDDSTSEGQSDLDEILQPPTKRAKLVHDPPPLSNRSRRVKSPVRTQKNTERLESRGTLYTASSEVRNNTDGMNTTQPNRLNSTSKSSAKKSSVSSSNLPKTTLLQAQPATKSMLISRDENAKPVTTFHAPELTQRKSRTVKATDSNKSSTIGKRFRNLSHMNNARKLHARKRSIGEPSIPTSELITRQEERHPTASSVLGTTETTPQSATAVTTFPTSEISSTPVQSDNGWQLFFSDDEEDEASKLKVEREDGETRMIDIEEHNDRTARFEPLNQPSPPIPPPTATGGVRNDILLLPPRTLSPPPRPASPPPRSSPPPPPPPDNTRSTTSLPTPTSIPRNADITLSSPTLHNSSNQSSLPLSVHTDLQRAQWQPSQATIKGHLMHQSTPKSDIIRVPIGREWVKSDLVIDLYVDHLSAGGVKIQGLPWAQRSPIISLKPKNEHQLPLDFDFAVTRSKYTALSNLASWWTIFAVGAVEPFTDSERTISSLADHLELHDTAMCWLHPSETVDLMLVLYSFWSPSWQDLNARQETRGGEARLNIVCRNKFKLISQSESLPAEPVGKQHKESVPEGRVVDVIETRNNNRRTSTASDFTPDILKSPSEHLAREMSEYGLRDKDHRRMSGTIDPEKASASTGTHQGHSLRTDTLPEVDVVPLSHQVKELSQSRIVPATPLRSESDVRVLLVHRPEGSVKARGVQRWLQEQVPSKEQIQIQVTNQGMTDQDDRWRNFKAKVLITVCVLICDARCALNRFDGLAKLLEQDNLICWGVDLAVTKTPLQTIKLFPKGMAMAVTQDCFLTDPTNTISILEKLRAQVEQPYSATSLMLPPNIGTAIQDQALNSVFPDTRTQFLRLAALIRKFGELSQASEGQQYGLAFSVIMTTWEDVYPQIAPMTGPILAVEQERLDHAMSDAFLKYFGAWGLRKLTNCRRFVGILRGSKPQDNEHVRCIYCNVFARDDKESGNSRRSRSRDPSRGRNRSQTRVQSKDRRPNDPSTARSRSRV